MAPGVWALSLFRAGPQLSSCLSSVLLSGLGGQGPEGAVAFPVSEPVAA